MPRAGWFLSVHVYWHVLLCEREACLKLVGRSSLAVFAPSSLLTTFVILFLPELHLRPNPLAATSHVLDGGAFS